LAEARPTLKRVDLVLTGPWPEPLPSSEDFGENEPKLELVISEYEVLGIELVVREEEE
jgi:hypothetical protein